MRKKLKGIAVSTVILIVLVVVAVIAIAILIGKGGFGFGGGKGNGEGKGEVSEKAVAVMESVTSASAATETLDYVEVTVSGSDYIFRNSGISLEDLISELKASGGISVKITDDNASQKAYRSLTSALDENDIDYIKEIKN